MGPGTPQDPRRACSLPTSRCGFKVPPKAGARTPGHRLAIPARVLASVAALDRAAQPPRPGPCPHRALLHALPGNRPVLRPAGPRPTRTPTAALPAPTPPGHLRSAAAARSLSAPPGAAEEPVASGLGPTAPDCGASRRRAKGGAGAGAEAGAFKRRRQPAPT
ncbi:lysine-rich arabinogalactan protein 18-like [Eumetopias jubatus]|uniref:lysine-rich arabinogalactan protein 18-like n=1 Tax=Eumetopias jubatus TaxID=34886 RepID=UPI001016B835|nr:lysine-rich arabinogalactan protein 18-like [Eumetopias jubatus]